MLSRKENAMNRVAVMGIIVVTMVVAMDSVMDTVIMVSMKSITRQPNLAAEVSEKNICRV